MPAPACQPRAHPRPRLSGHVGQSRHADRLAVSGKNFCQFSIGRVQIKHHQGALGSTMLHVNIDGFPVCVVASPTDTLLTLRPVYEVDDVEFTREHGRRRLGDMTLKVTIRVRLPAVEQVGMSISAYLKHRPPVIDGVVEVVATRVMYPIKSSVIENVPLSLSLFLQRIRLPQKPRSPTSKLNFTAWSGTSTHDCLTSGLP